MAAKAYAGVGCVYMASVDSAGTKTGNWLKVGNAYPLSVKVNTEQQKQISRMCDTAGQILAVKTEITDTVGSLVLKEWDAKNLAMALSGSAVLMSGVGADVAAEAVTAVDAGEYAELAHPDVSAVVVKDVTDATTYVLGTDYVLNAKLGLISILAAGAIAKDDVLHIDYTYAAESGYQINVGTTAQKRVAIKANLRDEFDSSREFLLEIDSAVLASSAEINFISAPGSEGEELPFTMTLETVSGQTSPMRVKWVN